MQTLRTSEVQNKKIKKIILLIIQYGNCITSTDLHAEVHTDTHKYKKAKKRLLENLKEFLLLYIHTYCPCFWGNSCLHCKESPQGHEFIFKLLFSHVYALRRSEVKGSVKSSFR